MYYSVFGVFKWTFCWWDSFHVLQVALVYFHYCSIFTLWEHITAHLSILLLRNISSVSSLGILQILVCVLWYTMCMNFFWVRVGLLNHRIHLHLTSAETVKQFVKVVVTDHTPTSHVGKFSLFHIPSSTWYCKSIILVILVGV